MSIVTFYRDDPNAPKTTRPTHLGVNAIITCDGKLLLEKRRDCDLWGLVGGGVKNHEMPIQAIVREVREELGLRIDEKRFRKLRIYDDRGRIAAYRDGSIWRMVIVAYSLKLDSIPEMTISKESRQLRFFSKEELADISVVVTHSDIIQQWFLMDDGE